jgi:predicted Zn-dependent protease
MTMNPAAQIVERALEASAASDCVVLVEEVSSANLRWANSTLTTNGFTVQLRCTIISVVNGAVATIQRDGVTPESVGDLVAMAESAARLAPRSPDATALVEGSSDATWGEETPSLDVHSLAALLEPLDGAIDAVRSRDELLFGYAEQVLSTIHLGTSRGLRARSAVPTGRIELNAKSRDMERSAYWSQALDLNHAPDVRGATDDLSVRLGWQRRRIDLEAGRYDTLLPPNAVADFMTYLYITASALDAFEGRTVFRRAGGGTRLGEKLSDVPVSLTSDPNDADPTMRCASVVQSFASDATSSVFDNGLALIPTSWITNGTLTGLIQTRHSAALTGHACTPLVDNLRLSVAEPSASSMDELVGSLERGLLATSLWYIRVVDPQTLLLTGLTRDGLYMVEGGEVTGAVNNFRFNESPVDLLARIIGSTPSVRAISRDFAPNFNRTAMPSLVIERFNMSSVSQAQ